MLAASRQVLFGGTSQTIAMGVSQELEHFQNHTAEQTNVFFVESPDYLIQQEEHADTERGNSCGETDVNMGQKLKVTAPQNIREHEILNNKPTGSVQTNLLTDQNISVIEQPSVRPKYGGKIIGLPDEMLPESGTECKKKKKKKWRTVGAEEMGFRLSLFPRIPVTDETGDAKKETDIFLAVVEEIESVAEKCRPFSHLLQLEGSGVAREEKFTRRDSDRRVQKAHLQVKSKNITSMFNNRGRKTLYIHFRLYKMFTFLQCSSRSHPNLPSPAKRPSICMEVARSATKAQCRASTGRYRRGDRNGAPPQDLAHALHNDNIPSELSTDVISFLISLQHREMTPEDYDMLLRLDEGVAPKTVSTDLLHTFKTDIVGADCVGQECAVCMERYELEQKRKFLPCGHAFHADCIDMWLNNSSMNCPLDGLPVDQS